jgi:hypothetical protein
MRQAVMAGLAVVISVGVGLSAQAKDLSILFIGNSYSFYPNTPENPGQVILFKEIVESIDPDLHIKASFHTHSGWTLEDHYKDKTSSDLLSQAYDQVVIQPMSLDPVDLPEWFEQFEGMKGLKSFSVYLPKVLDLAFQNNKNVTLVVTWARHPKHIFLQPDHPGRYFPSDSPRAGQQWYGNTVRDSQKMIDDSYAKYTAGYPVSFSRVGDAWLMLEQKGLVNIDELYRPGDWSHPSELGSFIESLVLVKATLHLDIRQETFIPETIDPVRARTIIEALAAQ